MALSSGDIAFFAQMGRARSEPWEEYARSLQKKLEVLEAHLAERTAEAKARRTVLRALIEEAKRHPDFERRHELLREIPDPANPSRQITKIQEMLCDELDRELEALGYRSSGK